MARFNKNMKIEDLPIPNLGLLEIALLQVVCYAALWLMSDYTATLLTVIFPILFLAILIISFLAELVQSSKIPHFYYWFMVVSILVPILTAAIFVAALGADFDWTKL